MPIERLFLDWRLPALDVAADILVDGRVVDGAVDLSEIVVALPGGRAGRRLLEILIAKAERQSLALVPPEIITAGRLPELLYAAAKPFADDFTQRLAWTRVLKQTDRGRLVHLIREPPSDGDLFAWLSLGEMLSRLHRQLAADRLDFGDVSGKAGHLPGFNETERWQLLAEMQQDYLRLLDELELWDMQTARLFAIEHEECATGKQIVLVGTVDLNRTQRAMLDQVADRVTALVFAPPEFADRFDEHGCLLPDAWQDAQIDLAAEQIEVVDAAGDQADAVVRTLAEFDAAFAAEEIAIGVPDERLVSCIRQRLDECGVPSRYGVGVPLSQTGPCLLLQAVADYIESRRSDAFAALVRHPAIADWLARDSEHGADGAVKGDWLTQLDDYYAAHFPVRVDGKWRGKPSLLSEVFNRLEGETGLLRGLTGIDRPLSEWAAAVAELLVSVYGRNPLNRDNDDDRVTLAVCEKIHEALSSQQAICEELTPCVGATDMLRLLLQSLGGETIPPRPDCSAVELLGWLELPLDDAPALIVTGFNEGLVPASRNSDLFLPNELRRQLGLEDNDRIYARDVYALSLLAASRKSLKLIAGRRTADNDPLTPSRLLFACDPEELARRTIAFLGDEPSRQNRAAVSGSLTAGRDRSIFAPPKPLEPLPEVTSMRVTEFRDYLACPYRYYLRHQLKLTAMDDRVDELGGGEFGSLLHDVLKAFGENAVAASDIADEIEGELSDLLNAEVKCKFGKRPLSAVAVQIEQIRLRLRLFAQWQADWVCQGWTIQVTEQDIKEGTAPFEVDGQAVYLRGRIDRIDYNRETGELVVSDYKTGDSAKKPEETHRRRDEWVDLQLPLYRHLVCHVDDLTDVDYSTVRLGYIVIPKEADKIGHHVAGWTAAELDHADDTARDVIRRIRNGCFWPPVDPAPAFFEEFSAICLDAQFGVTSATDSAEEG